MKKIFLTLTAVVFLAVGCTVQKHITTQELISLVQQNQVQNITLKQADVQAELKDGERVYTTLEKNTDILNLFKQNGITSEQLQGIQIKYSINPSQGVIGAILPFLSSLVLIAVFIFWLFMMKAIIMSHGDGVTKTLWVVGMFFTGPIMSFIYYFWSRKYKQNKETPPLKPWHLVLILIAAWVIGVFLSFGLV